MVSLYCTVLYCTVLYCTTLYCTVLYCTVLYCTDLAELLHGSAQQGDGLLVPVEAGRQLLVVPAVAVRGLQADRLSCCGGELSGAGY